MTRPPRWGLVAALVGVVASTMVLAGCALSTTTTLSANPTSAAPGQAVTFTAQVTSATTLKLTFVPGTVTVAGVALGQTSIGDGWTYDAASHVLSVRHSTGNHLVVAS